MTDRKDAVESLLEEVDLLIECVETTASEREAWERLITKLPALAATMKFNTYRIRAAAIVRTWKCAMAKMAATQTYSDIQKAATLDIQQDIHQAPHRDGFNLDGWYIQAGRDGYYRGYRKIGGRTRCLYIGKDVSKAKERIAAWHVRQTNKQQHDL